MAQPRYRHFICVSPDNNNKWYEMEWDGVSPTFTARWGRVEGHTYTRKYDIHKWDTTARKRLHKSSSEPYVEDTHLVAAQKLSDVSGGAHLDILSGVPDGEARALLEMLVGFSNSTISSTYKVKATSVTQAQVDRAQAVIDQLARLVSANRNDLASLALSANRLLIDLYQVIPRQMANVRDYLLEPDGTLPPSRIGYILDIEQSNLDTMSQQVDVATSQPKSVDTNAGKDSVLDKYGIEIYRASRAQIEAAQEALSAHNAGARIKRAWQVKHGKRDLFNEFMDRLPKQHRKELVLWHGSRNQNWLNILLQGLLVKPSNAVHTGSMFGPGIYFADNPKKSMGYTSIRGSYWARGSNDTAIMALFRVAVGNQLVVNKHGYWCYDLDSRKLNDKGGYHSVFAPRGADLINNEYIVYTPEQSVPELLVELY